ncbi:MAG: hypothetical protein JWR09_5481 [Mucilaginibacter sp.]|nr:hypothetical protein [Mucilaginibacter sp.]
MIKIIALFSNPTNEPVLRSGYEVNMIEQEISQAVGYPYIIVKEIATDSKSIQQVLHEESPDIVHFIGHGTETGAYITESANGSAKPLPLHTFNAIFRNVERPISCAVLNYCYSAVQAAQLSQYVDIVIGWQNKVQDSVSIKFVTTFYYYLCRDKNFQRSFELAKTAIEGDGIDMADVPVLFTKKDIVANEQVISVRPRIGAELTFNDKGKIKRKGVEYTVRVFIENWPDDAYMVQYFYDDKTFVKPYDRSKDHADSFEVFVVTYGDINIKATIWRRQSKRVEESGVGISAQLITALEKTYKDTEEKNILDALESIRNDGE